MPLWKYGDSWLRYDYQTNVSYVYINIPKNASCWMKENFGGFAYNWQTNQFDGPVTSNVTIERGLAAEKKYIVVLRDPITRWLSGFAQYHQGYHPNFPAYYANHHPDYWFDKVCFDDHTRPQVDFIQGLDHSQTTWFDCDQHLVGNIKQWMVGRFNHHIKSLDEDPENVYNVTKRNKPPKPDNTSPQQIIDHVSPILYQNPIYVQKLLDFYKEDVDLRASVEFYGTR